MNSNNIKPQRSIMVIALVLLLNHFGLSQGMEVASNSSSKELVVKTGTALAKKDNIVLKRNWVNDDLITDSSAIVILSGTAQKNCGIVNCITTNTWYKANWTNTSPYNPNFILNNSRITYESQKTKSLFIIISGNVLVDNAGRNITIGLVKNGVTASRYGETILRIVTENQAFQFAAVIYMENACQNDYFELYCSTNNSGDTVTFRDISWFVDSQ